MFRFESVAAAYFLFIATAAALGRAPLERAARATGGALLLVIIVFAASRVLADSAREWLPHLYLVSGYWLPSLLVPARGETAFESWLRRHDEGWRKHIGVMSIATSTILELSYLACYIVVPLAFVIVWSRGSRLQVEQFWIAVLLAGYACYGTLPWLVSRPPRSFIENRALPPRFAGLNVLVLRTVSHQLNTFPSGHVAVATTAALAVFPVSHSAGALLGVVAAGIAAGAAIGRYHYGIDVVVGVIVGIAAAVAALQAPSPP